MHCPICNSTDVSTVVEVNRLPVHVSDLFETSADALNAATGRISLAYCHRCTFIYNRSFDANRIFFEPGYEASLAHTATFRAYIENLVGQLIDDYQLSGKSVLEIGCGDGYFLRQLCRRGDNRGVGIDPTIKEQRTERVGEGSVQFISDYFSDRYRHLIADFICSISVFETIPSPRRFLTDLREMISDRGTSIVYFEVPNASYMFEKQATWSIYYEQFGHFTDETLASLFQRCGYEILKSGSCYEDGQYVSIEARAGNGAVHETGAAGAERHELPSALSAFAEIHRSNIGHWKSKLQQLGSAGKRIVAWGSGGKGSSFLNLLDTEKSIPYVIDINPHRQGKFIPGSAQEIVAPEFVAEHRPDVIIITNPIYEREIRQQVADLGVSCDFMSI